ncbi:MAG: 7-carboxy-7-deazaguanine synthase QueE [Legionellaceae bacterium]|nr:7-carboxy-7-deazaguanine synthase QueE [Legionellaceae bacterium]
MTALRITEIFYSLQGESSRVGQPTVFIRLTGCPLRCGYCDTAYAFKGGTRKTISNILTEVAGYNASYSSHLHNGEQADNNADHLNTKRMCVCVTGGEPLAQPECFSLLTQLCDAGYQVSLETSGAMDIAQVDPRVLIVMDIKTPDSLESDKNLWSNIAFLKPSDEVKFVLCSRADYDWACKIMVEHHLIQRVQVLFSSSWEQLTATQLADWIVSDRLPVRFQVQLHKYLWCDVAGR